MIFAHTCVLVTKGICNYHKFHQTLWKTVDIFIIREVGLAGVWGWQWMDGWMDESRGGGAGRGRRELADNLKERGFDAVMRCYLVGPWVDDSSGGTCCSTTYSKRWM